MSNVAQQTHEPARLARQHILAHRAIHVRALRLLDEHRTDVFYTVPTKREHLNLPLLRAMYFVLNLEGPHERSNSLPHLSESDSEDEDWHRVLFLCSLLPLLLLLLQRSSSSVISTSSFSVDDFFFLSRCSQSLSSQSSSLPATQEGFRFPGCAVAVY